MNAAQAKQALYAVTVKSLRAVADETTTPQDFRGWSAADLRKVRAQAARLADALEKKRAGFKV